MELMFRYYYHHVGEDGACNECISVIGADKYVWYVWLDGVLVPSAYVLSQ